MLYLIQQHISVYLKFSWFLKLLATLCHQTMDHLHVQATLQKGCFNTNTQVWSSTWDIQLVKFQLGHDTLNIKPYKESFIFLTKKKIRYFYTSPFQGQTGLEELDWSETVLPWQQQVSKHRTVEILYWNTKFQWTVLGPKIMLKTKDKGKSHYYHLDFMGNIYIYIYTCVCMCVCHTQI